MKRAGAVYLGVLAALNLYLCRGLFAAEYTGHMNSLQGLWITMARLAGSHWFWPAWWPYQDGGVPFEHTYMPLVPASAAVLSHLVHISTARAFFSVMGLVVAFGPVTLYILLWRMSGAPGYAFVASLIYAVTSPARAVLPETDVNPIRYWSSLRFYGAVVWDDLPHQTAVCLLPIALLLLWRSLETRRPIYYVLTALAMAATVSASVFGATALAMAAPCMLAARGRKELRANLRVVLALALTAYLLISPFLAPSIIATIRANQQRSPEDAWSARSLLALGIVLAGAALIGLALERVRAVRYVRFFVIFAFVAASIPVLDTYYQLHFIPQATRYTAEMELGAVMLVFLAISHIWSRLPRKIGIALAAFVLSLVAEHVAPLLNFTREATRAVDIRGSIEYRVARWVDSNMPGRRVMVPGSIAQWFNAFSTTPQLSGASFSTTPNWNEQDAMRSILSAYNPREIDEAMLWLKAWGIQAVVACGRNSPEFWKGVSSTKFDGLLPVLWRQEDTTIYGVPQRSPSLAHVIPTDAAARRNAAGEMPVAELRRYDAALDDPALPLADMRWESFRRVTIQTSLAAGQAVSFQTAYHPGWHATANGHSAPIRRDGLGFLLIEPRCQGPCRIELTYNGGFEYIACRILSLLAAIGLAVYYQYFGTLGST